MGYWAYYLGFIALTYALRSPWILLGIVLFLVLRRFIPDPGVLFRTWGRIQRLRAQIEANAANVSARRDLARLYIERKRPGRAVGLLKEALERFPSDAELLFLLGLGLHQKGEHEAALDPLVRAVGTDPRVGFGEPYLIAGNALFALGRLDEAEDAYARFVEANGSAIEGQLKLARTLSRAGKREEAVRAVDEALDTYSKLPGYARRRQFGWWLRTELARATIQRRPGAIAFVLLGLGIVGFGFLVAAKSVHRDLVSRTGVLPRTFGVHRFLPPPPPRTRFVRAEPEQANGAVHVAFRESSRGDDPAPLGDFACRIWALYGPPDAPPPSDFSFTLRDTQNGTVFVARALHGRPEYATPPTLAAKATVTLDAFDALLDTTRPVDCIVSISTESGPIGFGLRGGAPVVEPAD